MLRPDQFTDYKHVDLRYRVFLTETLLRNIDKLTTTFFIDPKTKAYSSSRVS